MGFDFSAVTALLGGYSATCKRQHDSDDDVTQYRRRGDGRLRRSPAGPQDAGDGGLGEITVAARLDGPPVTGGAGGALSGIGRALDALMSAEETRRRKGSDCEGPAGTSAAPLSTVLKASLPKRKALPDPNSTNEEARLLVARSDGERNWEEIREFIEALGRAERPAEPQAKVDASTVKPGDVRPWRPKMAS